MCGDQHLRILLTEMMKYIRQMPSLRWMLIKLRFLDTKDKCRPPSVIALG
jgi:hypothetical protein